MQIVGRAYWYMPLRLLLRILPIVNVLYFNLFKLSGTCKTEYRIQILIEARYRVYWILIKEKHRRFNGFRKFNFLIEY